MHSCLSLALVVIKQTFFLHLYFSISLEAILQEHLHVHMAGRHQQPFLSKENYHCAERSLRLGRRGQNCEVFPINRENILHRYSRKVPKHVLQQNFLHFQHLVVSSTSFPQPLLQTGILTLKMQHIGIYHVSESMFQAQQSHKMVKIKV